MLSENVNRLTTEIHQAAETRSEFRAMKLNLLQTFDVLTNLLILARRMLTSREQKLDFINVFQRSHK